MADLGSMYVGTSISNLPWVNYMGGKISRRWIRICNRYSGTCRLYWVRARNVQNSLPTIQCGLTRGAGYPPACTVVPTTHNPKPKPTPPADNQCNILLQNTTINPAAQGTTTICIWCTISMKMASEFIRSRYVVAGLLFAAWVRWNQKNGICNIIRRWSSMCRWK